MEMTVLRLEDVAGGRTWWIAFEGERVLGVYNTLAEARDAVGYERDRRARPRRGLDGQGAGPARRRPTQVRAEAWRPVVDAWLSGTTAGINLELVDGDGHVVPWDGRDPRLMLTRLLDAHRPVVRRPGGPRRPVPPLADDPGGEPAVVPSQPK